MARLFSLHDSRPALREGARVGLFAPSGVYSPDLLHAGSELLRSWGLVPVAAPHLGSSHHYLAGSDSERLSDLVWAMSDPSLDAAWLVRGGYGILRLLPLVPWDRLSWDRPVVGFSDATGLFVSMRKRGFFGAIHAPVAQALAGHVNASSREALRCFLMEREAVEWPLTVADWSANVSEPFEGPLVGGNLCTLATLCGTSFGIESEKGILLLEEVGEPPYKLDRLVTQLRLSAALDAFHAVVLGELLDCNPPDGTPWTLSEVLADLFGSLGVPVLLGAPVGHGEVNKPFRYGTLVRVTP
jgi:muramoyltetrapeptide carboxypeptidase